jgi:hypothetical protein
VIEKDGKAFAFMKQHCTINHDFDTEMRGKEIFVGVI